MIKQWWSAVIAVLWSFLGIRRQKSHQSDANDLKPIHFIVVGVFLAVVFVVSLLVIVGWLVARRGG